MIRITEKYKCCGCTACASICGHNSITMFEDVEGFKYPRVNQLTCVECGLCEEVCPMIHPDSDMDVTMVIGAKSLDESVRKASSSGGAFSLLADFFIARGGVVVGCAMDDNLKATHVICNTQEELIRLRSSKYVQSDMNGVYRDVRAILKQGKELLFSGTPCQVAGLRRFLIKPYNNLFCIDILCHGVPSPKLFREYKEMKERELGAKANFVSFRCKKKEWKRLYIEMLFNNGKEYFKSATFDPYMQLFLGNQSQRSSCFHCPFTTTKRQGDISLGDFWGVGRKYQGFDDDKGVSMILVNSRKGEQMYAKIKKSLDDFTSDIEYAIVGNKVLVENISGEDKRDMFYGMYVTDGLQVAFENNTKFFPLWKQYYLNFMRWGLDLVRKIMHKGY